MSWQDLSFVGGPLLAGLVMTVATFIIIRLDKPRHKRKP
jgi:hypothetical protein